MMVLNFTTGTEDVDDDDVGGGVRTDGVVLLNGDVIFRLPDIGWMRDEHDRDMTITNAFALKLISVIQ